MLFNCCALKPPARMPEKLVVTGIDFSQFSDKGFLFTIDKYLGEYESIGIVEIDFVPEAYLSEIVGSRRNSYNFEVNQKKVDLEVALDRLYDICVEMGANALTQIEFDDYELLYPRTLININGIKIRGFAINRL